MFYVLYNNTGKITSTIMTDEKLKLVEPHLIFDEDEKRISSILSNCWEKIKVDTTEKKLIVAKSADRDYFVQEVLGGLIVPTLIPTKRNIALLEKQVDFLVKVVLGMIDENVDPELVQGLRKIDKYSSLTGRVVKDVLETVVEGKKYLRKIVAILRGQEDKYTTKKSKPRIRWKRHIHDNKGTLAKHQLHGLLSFLLESTPEETGKELRELAEKVPNELDDE